MEKSSLIKLPFVMAKGLLAAVVLSAASIFVLSFLLLNTNIRESTIHIVVIIMYGISCLVSGFYCGKKIKTRRFLWGLIAGGLYFALLCILTMTIKEGQLSNHVLASALVCLGSGMLGGMVSG